MKNKEIRMLTVYTLLYIIAISLLPVVAPSLSPYTDYLSLPGLIAFTMVIFLTSRTMMPSWLTYTLSLSVIALMSVFTFYTFGLSCSICPDKLLATHAASGITAIAILMTLFQSTSNPEAGYRTKQINH